MDNMPMGKYEGKNCRCPHHWMVPIFMVLIGLVFLLGYWGVVSSNFVSVAWPVLLILAGLQIGFGRRCKCCNSSM